MIKTNLHVFYQLGTRVKGIHEVRIGMPLAEAMLSLTMLDQSLVLFLAEIALDNVDMPDSTRAARALIDAIRPFTTIPVVDINKTVTRDDITRMHHTLRHFEESLDREFRLQNAFIVTPIGIYNSTALIEATENKIPEHLRKYLPDQTVQDLREAGRCLAFDIPTACAFHICRGTEALMLKYYEVLANHPWNLQRRDWNTYIQHLVKEGAPPAITTRLDEIRKIDRNAYAHPEINVTVTESPVIFELCAGVTFFMLQEIEKLSV